MAGSIVPRPTQTKVKHLILERYVKAWGGIILAGLKGQAVRARSSDNPLIMHFVYVDCNASAGRYRGELEDDEATREGNVVEGSPLIGVRALDSLMSTAATHGITLRTNVILIEQSAATLAELRRSIDMAGFGPRARATRDFSSLQPGEIAIVHGDSTSMASQLTRYTQAGWKYSFFFLDPYGPKGIPLTFVGEIIQQQRHDAIINMPYQDLHRKSGLIPMAGRSSADAATLSNYDAMFGNTDWQALAARINTNAFWTSMSGLGADGPSGDAPQIVEAQQFELELVDLYRRSLQSVDNELAIKSIRLHYPRMERTMFHLYLTTHDATGAITMNRILRDAQLQEHELRWRLKQADRLHNTGQMHLFPEVLPPSDVTSKVPKETMADYILRRFEGRTLTRRDIYRDLANEPYLDTEITSGLAYLMSKNQAHYQKPLKNDTLIQIGTAKAG